MIDGLVEILEDVPAASARYQVRDDLGVPMDTLKIIEGTGGGYLGVYHRMRRHRLTVHVATSTDLLHWTHRAVLDDRATQPTIAALPDGSYLVVVEAGGGGGPAWLRVHHYPTVDRLLAGDADRTADLPHTQVPPGRLAEGTPNIYAATLAPDLDHSVIDIGFHYLRDGDVDRQARGCLTDFRRWRAAARPELDAAVEARSVRGNIGGRDVLTWHGVPVTVLEGQLRKGDWSSWRVFLYWVGSAPTEGPGAKVNSGEPPGAARPLRIRTHGGSTAFANPAVTLLRSPAGAPAVCASMFLFAEGAAAGEAGQLVYYREIG
jgi:hypothetical protein